MILWLLFGLVMDVCSREPPKPLPKPSETLIPRSSSSAGFSPNFDSIKPGRVAIVSTVRSCPKGMLRDFICYHLSLGFDRIFIFFDDPHDADIEVARSFEGVTAILNGKYLHTEWTKSKLYNKLGAFRNSEVMARQLLNTEVALGLCRRKKIEWLLHIDSDELWFSSQNVSVQSHFEELSNHGFNQAVYMNVEGVPTSAGGSSDVFRGVKWFKRNQVSFSEQSTFLAQHEWTNTKSVYQQGYFVGKAAGRVKDTDIFPLEVTRYFIKNEKRAVFDDPCLLHFINPSADAAAIKYSVLGTFSDLTWDHKLADPAFRKHAHLFPPESQGLAFHNHMRDVAQQGLQALQQEMVRVSVLDMKSANAQRWIKMGLLLNFDIEDHLDQCLSLIHTNTPAPTPTSTPPPCTIIIDDDGQELCSINRPSVANPKSESGGTRRPHGLGRVSQCLNQAPTAAGRTEHVHCYLRLGPDCCAAIKLSRGTLKIPESPY